MGFASNASNRIVLSATLAAMLALPAAGCAQSPDASQEPSTPAMRQEAGVSASADVEQAPDRDDTDTVAITDDAVVNDFILAYNEISQSPIESAEKGNIRTKYFAYSHGYYLELLNANDTGKIHVTINETNENASEGTAGMRDVFREVVLTCDPTLSAAEIDALFESLHAGDAIADGSALGTVMIDYVPDTELSGGHSRGHIAIAAQ